MALSLKDLVASLASDVQPVLENLYSRWLDEHEYEDIKDYGRVLAPYVAKVGGTLDKMTKRPFGFVVKFQTQTGPVKVKFSINSHVFSWKRV